MTQTPNIPHMKKASANYLIHSKVNTDPIQITTGLDKNTPVITDKTTDPPGSSNAVPNTRQTHVATPLTRTHVQAAVIQSKKKAFTIQPQSLNARPAIKLDISPVIIVEDQNTQTI